jgi:hypothetical protein
MTMLTSEMNAIVTVAITLPHPSGWPSMRKFFFFLNSKKEPVQLFKTRLMIGTSNSHGKVRVTQHWSVTLPSNVFFFFGFWMNFCNLAFQKMKKIIKYIFSAFSPFFETKIINVIWCYFNVGDPRQWTYLGIWGKKKPLLPSYLPTYLSCAFSFFSSSDHLVAAFFSDNFVAMINRKI